MIPDVYKAMWQQQPVADRPDKRLLAAAMSRRMRLDRRKYCAALASVFFTVIVMGIVFYFVEGISVYTMIGLASMGASLCLAVIHALKVLSLLGKKPDYTLSASGYLARLIRLKNLQVRIQARVMYGYMILMWLGVVFSTWEYVVKFEPTFIPFLFHGVVAAWFGFNLFYLVPRSNRKNRQEIQQFITLFKALED